MKTLCSACGKSHSGRCDEGDKEEAIKAGVPTMMIDMIVGNRPVWDPVTAVIEDMRLRCEKAGTTEALKAACCKYAESVHNRNIKLYNDVMSGKVG